MKSLLPPPLYFLLYNRFVVLNVKATFHTFSHVMSC